MYEPIISVKSAQTSKWTCIATNIYNIYINP